MKYLLVFNDNEAKRLIKEGKATEFGPYKSLVVENIEYMIDEISEKYNLCKEEIENVRQYLAQNWIEIEIDEENLQLQLKDLASEFIEEERQYKEMDGE